MTFKNTFLSAFAALGISWTGVSLAADETIEPGLGLALENFLGQKVSEILSKKTDNLQLKYIEPNAEDDQPGWGVDYSWKAAKASAPRFQPEDGKVFEINRMSYELAIDGSYAFDDATNNQDLSTITASFKMAHGNFGKLDFVAKEISDAYLECLKPLPVPQSEEEAAAFDRAAFACAKANGIDQKVTGEDDPAYFYWVDFRGGVEANQDYSQTHTLFGLAGALAYQPDSAGARYNVFDIPFGWIRRAFADGENEFVAPYPSILLGIDRLDADEKDPRSALTNDKTYNRIRGEVAFATQIASISGQVVRLTTSYRYYKELSAPAAVKTADLDEFNFFTASLRFPAKLLPLVESEAYELFVSYTDGKLPFGVANDQTFEVGISTNIDALAELLGK
jgi:hypothetical protein